MKFYPSKQLTEFLNATVFGKKYPIHEFALEGPKGSGKTEAAKFIHRELMEKDKEFTEDSFLHFVCSKETSFADFTAEKTIKDGSIEDKVQAFLTTISKPSVILVDKYKLAQPDVHAGLNSLLDNCKSITLASGQVHVRHPKSIIIFSTNPETYAGVKRQHSGFIDRLPTFEMEYTDKEDNILRERYPELKKTLAKKFQKFAQLMRNAKATKGIRTEVSTRALEIAAKMTVNGIKPEKSLLMAIKPMEDEMTVFGEYMKLVMNATLVKVKEGKKITEELSLLAGLETKLKDTEEKNKESREKVASLQTKLEEIFKAAGLC